MFEFNIKDGTVGGLEFHCGCLAWRVHVGPGEMPLKAELCVDHFEDYQGTLSRAMDQLAERNSILLRRSQG